MHVHTRPRPYPGRGAPANFPYTSLTPEAKQQRVGNSPATERPTFQQDSGERSLSYSLTVQPPPRAIPHTRVVLTSLCACPSPTSVTSASVRRRSLPAPDAHRHPMHPRRRVPARPNLPNSQSPRSDLGCRNEAYAMQSTTPRCQSRSHSKPRNCSKTRGWAEGPVARYFNRRQQSPGDRHHSGRLIRLDHPASVSTIF